MAAAMTGRAQKPCHGDGIDDYLRFVPLGSAVLLKAAGVESASSWKRFAANTALSCVITTGTTVMALGVMCIVSKLYGLDSMCTFAFPLMTGMLSGVYTSLCVSTSAWVVWSERKNAKKN